jgi:hypothetical protein
LQARVQHIADYPGNRNIGLVRLLATLVVALALLLSMERRADGQSRAPPAPEAVGEYLVKVGFLYNFGKLTTWPQPRHTDAPGPFLVCVIGADPFKEDLDAIDGKTVGARTIIVRRDVDVVQASQCHVAFIAATEAPRLSQHLGALGGRPVLTVSDMPNFARSGGIIELKTVDSRVRFAINLRAARRAGLNFSSKLLQLAEIVGPTAKAE